MKQFELIINGKTYPCVEYSEELGKLELDEAAQKTLHGKSIQEQAEHWGVAESSHTYKTFYGDEGNDSRRVYSVPLLQYSGLQQLIVHGGILVGAVIEGYYGSRSLLPGRSVCTYDISETDGSGTIERTDYASLIFNP